MIRKQLLLSACALVFGCSDENPTQPDAADSGDAGVGDISDLGDARADAAPSDTGNDGRPQDIGELLPNEVPPALPPQWSDECPGGTVSGTAGPCEAQSPQAPEWDCDSVDGWDWVSAHGVEVCDAPDPPDSCELGFYPHVSSADCVPLGAACPDSTWLSEGETLELVPEFEGAELVRVGSSDGADFADLDAALSGTSGDLVISLAAEAIGGSVRLNDRRVAIVGACVDSTLIGIGDAEMQVENEGELALANLSLAQDSGAIEVVGSGLSLRNIHALRSGSSAVVATESEVSADTVWFQARGGEGYSEPASIELDESSLVGADITFTDVGGEAIEAAPLADVDIERAIFRGRGGVDGSLGIYSGLRSEVRVSTAIFDRFSNSAFDVGSSGFLEVDIATVRRISAHTGGELRASITVALSGAELELSRVVARDLNSRGVVMEGASARISDSFFGSVHNDTGYEIYPTLAATADSTLEVTRSVVSDASHFGIGFWGSGGTLTDVSVIGAGSDSHATYGSGLFVNETSTLAIERVDVIAPHLHGLRAQDGSQVSGVDLTIESSPSGFSVPAGTASITLSGGAKAELERVSISDAPTVAIFVSERAEASVQDLHVLRAGLAAVSTRPYAVVAVGGTLEMQRTRASGIVQGFAGAAQNGTLELRDFVIEGIERGPGIQHQAVLNEATVLLERGEISLPAVGAVSRGPNSTLSLTDVVLRDDSGSNVEAAHGIELREGAAGVLTNVRIESARGVGIFNDGGELDADTVSVSQVGTNGEGAAHGILTYDGRTTLRNTDVRGAEGVAIGFAPSASGSVTGTTSQASGICLAGSDASDWIAAGDVSVNQCEADSSESLGFPKPSNAQELLR